MSVTTTNNNAWRPFASFVVEFQIRRPLGPTAERRTKVHHIEQDTCAHWPGLEKAKLCQWMQEQANVSLGVAQRETPKLF